MDARQYVLQKAAEALQEVNDIHKDINEFYYGPEVKSLGQPLQDFRALRDKISNASCEISKQPFLTIPIASLYAAQYASETDRQDRIIELLENCCHHAHQFVEAAAALDKAMELKHAHPAWPDFKKAVVELEQVLRDLKTLAAIPVLPPSSPDIQSEAIAAKLHPSSNPGALVSTEEYLRRRLPYEDQRKAVLLRDFLTHLELSSVVVEPASAPFQRFSTIKNYPIYRGFRTRTDRRIKYVDDFDQINAVWYSLIATGCIVTRNAATYREVFLAMIGTQDETTMDSADIPVNDARRRSIQKAKGLRSLDIVLGIIFEDDPSNIVWPLGKPATHAERAAVIYCRTHVHLPNSSDRYYYHTVYEGIKFLEDGQVSVRPPRANYAFSSIRRHLITSSKNKDTLGPFWPSFLPSILAIANQAAPNWKPFPFLLLPAEIKNQIYEEYLSHHDSKMEWAVTTQRSGLVNVPPLGQVNRELLGHVLPMYLAKKPLCVDREDRERFVQLGRQRLLRPLLKFKDIDLEFNNSSRIAVQVTAASPPALQIRYEGHNGTPYLNIRRIFSTRKFEDFVHVLFEDATGHAFSFEDIAAMIRFVAADKESRDESRQKKQKKQLKKGPEE